MKRTASAVWLGNLKQGYSNCAGAPAGLGTGIPCEREEPLRLLFRRQLTYVAIQDSPPIAIAQTAKGLQFFAVVKIPQTSADLSDWRLKASSTASIGSNTQAWRLR